MSRAERQESQYEDADLDNPHSWPISLLGSAIFEISGVFMILQPDKPSRLVGAAYVAGGALLWADMVQKLDEIRSSTNSPTDSETDICDEEVIFTPEQQDELNSDLAALDAAHQAGVQDTEIDTET